MEDEQEILPSPALKVLVIDDHEAHAEGLAELLALAGFETSYALTGEAGVAAAREQDVDVVLLDMNLRCAGGCAAIFRLSMLRWCSIRRTGRCLGTGILGMPI